MKRMCWFVLLAVNVVAPELALAVDRSTYSFNSGMNCQGVWRLPDTGQTLCYNATTSIACPSPGQAFYGQDAQYQPVAIQPSYTVLNPVGISSVTVDNRTGLMWVTDPRTDAGFKTVQTWESALTSCTVTLNGMAYAGYTDWRLPNVRELMSIVNFGVAASPMIDTTAFPNTVSNNYWSSTTYAPATTSAWKIIFAVAFTVASANKTEKVYVRCVRGGP